MNEIIINEHYAEPIGVKKIIKGVMNEITNEATGITTITGDYEILYDISANRNKPYFLIARRTKKGE